MKTYDNFEAAEAIERYIHSERDRTILKMSIIDGDSVIKIADKCGLSYRYTWTLIKKGKDILSNFIAL